LGNHDYTVTDGDKARVIPTLGMDRDYYSFHHAGVRFVMLDTNDLSIYKHAAAAPATAEAKALLEKLKADNSTAAKPWNGGISKTQLDWLERELAAADAAKERVVVCGHHPLLPEAGHQVWNNREVIAVIERHSCVLAYLNGHDHAGAEVVRNGVPYITFKSLLHEPGVIAYSAVRVFEDRLEIEGNGREVSRVVAVRKG
jgi:manganese-dependent ADP-ribose/CDP-alcohol diphosphatase